MGSMTKYHISLNLREKTMVFWTLAFPLLLGLFFYFGLGGIDDSEQFSAIPVVVLQETAEAEEVSRAASVRQESAAGNTSGSGETGNNVSARLSGESADTADSALAGIDSADANGKSADAQFAQMNRRELFSEFLDGISGDLIDPVYDLSEAEAKQALEDGDVVGIFDNRGESPRLTLGSSGLSESILTALLDGFLQQVSIVEDIQADLEAELSEVSASVETAATPQETAEAAQTLQETADSVSARMEALADSVKGEQAEYIREVSLGGRDVSSITPYYFALVAMACLYMCFLGETAARRTQANISEIGKRLSVSPTPRLRLVISNGISAYVIALINMAIVMFFLIEIVHGLDISMHPGYAAATCMMGCLIGVTFGILIESIGKWSQNIKSAILIGSSIFCAFLAGLMIGSIKDIIEKHIPIVNRINPAALIADSFYCICVYDDMPRLAKNLGIMGIMSAVFLLGAWLLTRRVRYDSL